MRHSDEDTVGEVTTRFYRRFNIKIGIFGVGGMTHNGQLLDFTPEEANLTRAIIECSEQCWLVADKSKLGRYAPVVSGELSEMQKLFVDEITPEFLQLCQDHQVTLIPSR